MKTVFIGCDHAGFQTKLFVIEFLQKNFPHLNIEDCGCNSTERTNYTNYSKIVAQNVVKFDGIGILVCGSGIGVSIVANKFKGVRAALIYSKVVAELSRQHNDANVACFGARMFSSEEINAMIEVFLKTEFLGGVHLERLKNIEI